MPASYKYPPSSREHEKQQRPSVYTADEHVAQTCSSLFFPLFSSPPFVVPLFIFLSLHCSICYCVSLTVFFLFFVCSPYLPSPAFLPQDLLNHYLSVLCDLPPLLSRVILILSSTRACTRTHAQIRTHTHTRASTALRRIVVAL